jgi:(p)ppGpp synthase/HD superfamily hydrolase
MPTLDDAITLAHRAHAGQVDKAGQPYITHPLRLMDAVATDEEKIVAVLHDVVEDSDVTINDLRAAGYSAAVVEAIACLTKREGEQYEAFIQRAASNVLAKKIKIVDLHDNMDMGRIAYPTKQDYARLEKYRHALQILQQS